MILATGATVLPDAAAVAAEPPEPPSGRDIGATASGDTVTIAGSHGQGAGAADAENRGPTEVYKRRPQVFCGSLDGSGAVELCVDGVASGAVTRLCADGSVALDPLYRREVDPTTGAFLGEWVQVDLGGCVEDPDPTVILTAAEFRRLPLTASAPQVQPADGRGLVGMDLIVFTDPAAQVLTTTILGVPVVVRATPTSYAWDFGDGTPPLVTSDPGRPYPHQTVARPYSTEGTFALRLVTTWSGTYQVNGIGPWQTVSGTATTTSAPLTTQVLAASSTLVADPLP